MSDALHFGKKNLLSNWKLSPTYFYNNMKSSHRYFHLYPLFSERDISNRKKSVHCAGFGGAAYIMVLYLLEILLPVPIKAISFVLLKILLCYLYTLLKVWAALICRVELLAMFMAGQDGIIATIVLHTWNTTKWAVNFVLYIPGLTKVEPRLLRKTSSNTDHFNSALSLKFA